MSSERSRWALILTLIEMEFRLCIQLYIRQVSYDIKIHHDMHLEWRLTHFPTLSANKKTYISGTNRYISFFVWNVFNICWIYRKGRLVITVATTNFYNKLKFLLIQQLIKFSVSLRESGDFLHGASVPWSLFWMWSRESNCTKVSKLVSFLGSYRAPPQEML